MSVPNQSPKTRVRRAGQVYLQVPQELADVTKELLDEMVSAKKKERLAKEVPKSKIKSVFSWIKDNATALATIITMFSALWTVNQYFIQRSQSEKLQRQTLIAQFAGNLSDKTKREAAVYALANLAGKDSIPLLTSELKQNALFENDPSYQNAISQALITIGKPALDSVVAINREYAQSPSGFTSAEDVKIISATQPVISYFLINKLDAFRKEQRIHLGNKITLEGIAVQKAHLSFLDFSGIKFSQVRLTDSDLCETSFKNADIENSYFYFLDMGDNNFENTKITHTTFHHSFLERASFNGLVADGLDFNDAILTSTKWINAKIKNADFSSATLEYADFKSASLANIDFSWTKAGKAKFSNATLTSSDFTYANLEQADFTGASLAGVKFFDDQHATPYLFSAAIKQSTKNDSGAFVRGANFAGAQDLDEQSRVYLCTWGATNVPGGCAGVQVEDTSAYNNPVRPGASLCF